MIVEQTIENTKESAMSKYGVPPKRKTIEIIYRVYKKT